MELIIKGSPKEIADLVVALQGQRKSNTVFVPRDSIGYHFKHGKSIKDPSSKN